MKKLYGLVLLALSMISCQSGNERVLTSATGSIYECLVICDESDAQQAVSATMNADMYGLPQMESFFTVSAIKEKQFDDLFKSTRNILLIDINEQKYTQVKILKARDMWAKPQAYIRIQAPDEAQFLDFWNENGTSVREWFVREEMARQRAFYRAGTNKEARAALSKQGYDMWIPEDFMVIKNEDVQLTDDQTVHVLWCCNNKGPMRKDVLVYSYPYTSQDQFTNEAIIAMRDEVVGRLVSAQVPGSHMGTEFRHFPPVSRSVPALRDTTGGFYAMETRGLWRIFDGESMGGPFVSLTRLDQVNARVVTAETFIYAPGQKKRNAVRQCEAILYSLHMPQDQ